MCERGNEMSLVTLLKELTMIRFLRVSATLVGLLACVAAWAGEPRIEYPNTRRVDHVDMYHGVKVPDPYRWLEDDIRTSPAVADWVAAENKITSAYLAAIPQREKIRRRLTDLWNFAQFSSPMKEGNRYFYFKNDGLQNQAVLYVTDSLEGKPRVLLDPNGWSKDGTIALGGLGSAMTERNWPIAVARPVPIGRPGTCWTSRPDDC